MKPIILISLLASAGISFAQQGVRELIDTPDNRERLEKAEELTRNQLDSLTLLAEKAKDPAFRKVLEFQIRHITTKAGVAAGDVRLFPNIVANWQTYQAHLEDMKSLVEELNTEVTPARKAEIQSNLLKVLEVVGPYLKSATHEEAERRILDKAEQTTMKQLAAEFNKTDSDGSAESEELRLLTSDHPYTLKFLPIPIQFEAPEGTEIIVSAETGGHFENELSKIRIKADENNRATTWWMSTGDAVSTSTILFKSKKYTGRGVIQPVVKRLVQNS